MMVQTLLLHHFISMCLLSKSFLSINDPINFFHSFFKSLFCNCALLKPSFCTNSNSSHSFDSFISGFEWTTVPNLRKTGTFGFACFAKLRFASVLLLLKQVLCQRLSFTDPVTPRICSYILFSLGFVHDLPLSSKNLSIRSRAVAKFFSQGIVYSPCASFTF